jgi:hypothetical protein
MSATWSEEIDSILDLGVSLESIGIKNWALNKTDALNAIKMLENSRIPVLGGDVYKLVGNAVEQTYDNWYCNQEAGESNDDFLCRSLNTARKYIDDYYLNEALFAVVPKI